MIQRSSQCGGECFSSRSGPLHRLDYSAETQFISLYPLIIFFADNAESWGYFECRYKARFSINTKEESTLVTKFLYNLNRSWSILFETSFRLDISNIQTHIIILGVPYTAYFLSKNTLTFVQGYYDILQHYEEKYQTLPH